MVSVRSVEATATRVSGAAPSAAGGGGGAPLPPPPPAAPAGLPAGWEEHVGADGTPYYHNVKTGATSWDRPAAAPWAI